MGGETPIVDSRKVFDAIPSKIRDRFLEKGVMYEEIHGTGLGLDWRTVFRTDDRRGRKGCKDNRLDFGWKPNGGSHDVATVPLLSAMKEPGNGHGLTVLSTGMFPVLIRIRKA